MLAIWSRQMVVVHFLIGKYRVLTRFQYLFSDSVAPEIPEVSPEEAEELSNVYKDDRITLESETLYANVT